MKKNNKIVFLLLVVVFFAGCATVNPMSAYFENHFNSFKAAERSAVRSESLKRSFARSYDEVWDNTLYILAQQAVIGHLSKDKGVVSYVDIDGVFFADVFISGDRFLYWEFPFTVLIESGPQGTTVYVHPMIGLSAEKGSKRKQWNIVEQAFWQKSEKFLDDLSTQLSAGQRWPWLTGPLSRSSHLSNPLS